MPRQLQRSLQGYLSKIKRETGKIQLPSNSFSSSKNWVLSGCKHPKTLSFSVNRRHRRRKSKSKDGESDRDSGHAATLSDIDRFLEENFKSLCIRDDDGHGDDEGVGADSERDRAKKKLDESEDDDDSSDDDDHDRFQRAWGPALYDSPKPSEAPSDPRRSELPTEEGRRSIATTTTTTTTASMLEEIPSSSNSSTFRYGGRSAVLPENCIAVLRNAPDPQEEFRRSMVEMVEGRLYGMKESEVDWEFMEEVLFCYLELNDKKSHRFILSAFVDLIVVLRQEEKTVTRNGMTRSLSSRIARDRLRRRMRRPF
ncbi:PREDICTED: transcription repressor OFP14 [Tarenaya hassleriana]|uniref:transcription repressor OFP14 n=1 Tax=Tarenaya hassleriana TaxID=28532 RepID=UPI00053C9236|nr:PREDICTED: transcription repressor OFP14 [Tarenaya hassleriana]